MSKRITHKAPQKVSAASDVKPKSKRRRWPSVVMVSAGTIFCLVFAFVALYPVLRNYYIASREYELLDLEYEAVLARNEKIEEQISSLQTSEGVADRAREQFGWVSAGEEAVNITGLNISDSSTVLPVAVSPDSIVLEATWWTDFLDKLFNIDKSKPVQEIYDPFIG